MQNNPFKGSIHCTQNNKAKSKLLNFDVSKKATFHFSDILLCEFQHLHLSNNEKKNLTHKDRENIKKYQSVNCKTIQEFSEQLIQELEKKKSKKIYINAEDFGVYICLAAIYSGKLPQNKEITFILKNTPLSIFPKNLMKKNPNRNLNVQFSVSQDSWLSPFKSLYDHIPGNYTPAMLKAA